MARLLFCCPSPGVVNPPGGGATELEIREQAQHGAEDIEELVGQWAVNFNVLDAGIINLVCNLSAFTWQTGQQAIYRVRLGGTYGLPTGTEIARLTTGYTTYQDIPGCSWGAVFARPSGCWNVKLTIEPEEGEEAHIQGTGITFVGS